MLDAIHRRLSGLDRHKEAFGVCEEGIRVLLPYFCQNPKIHGFTMAMMRINYLLIAAGTAHEPDRELLEQSKKPDA